MELHLRLETRTYALEVELIYIVYDGFAVIRKRVAITNRSSQTVKLTHLAFEAVNVSPGSSLDLELSGRYGHEPRALLYTGRVDDAALVLWNARTHEGCAILNEAPGQLKRTEIMAWNPFWGARVRVMYDTDLFPFERTLEPGGQFTSAAASVLFYQDDHRRLGLRRAMAAYTATILGRQGADFRPPWLYNTWSPFEHRIDEATCLELIPVAAQLGFEVFCLDEGWLETFGENTLHPTKFPHGLAPIVTALEAQGMRLGLWYPIASVDTNSRAYLEHPEWACQTSDAQVKKTETAEGDKIVMCLGSPFRQDSAARLIELIGRYNLAYIKLDLTTIFNAYGEEPGCSATGHDHHSWAQSLCRIYEGIKFITDSVYAIYPKVLLDLTFELWGQKHLIDYGLLAAGDLDWLSNVGNKDNTGGPRQARMLLYQRALAIPVERMLIGNLQAEVGNLDEHFATVIGSAPLLLGDLRKLEPQARAWYAEKIAWFKDLRETFAIWQNFVPLGLWWQPSADDWDGFARLTNDGEGMIAVFRNQSSLPEVRLVLSLPQGQYHLKAVIGEFEQTVSALELHSGLGIPFTDHRRSEVLEIKGLVS